MVGGVITDAFRCVMKGERPLTKWLALLSTMASCCGAHAQDLSDPTVPLPPNAQFATASWLPGVREWVSGVRDLAGGVKSFRNALADLIGSIKGWTLIEEDRYYLVRMESDILFDFDSATIREEAQPSLKRFAEVLASYEIRELTITGHTDSKGTDAYNDKLSLRRAKSVEAFLKGTQLLAGWRFTSVGRGERSPIAPNTGSDGRDDPVGRQKNRRVELRIKKAPKS